MNDDRHQQQSELEWLAFRYVAGELTAEEAGAFEQRLAEDQAAREAVAGAVALGLQLANAKPATAGPSGREALRAPRFRDRALHALAWASVGVAASVAIWAVSHVSPVGEIGPPVAESNSTTAPRELVVAVAWLQLRNLGESSTEIERGLDESDADELAEPNRNSVLPSWVVNMNEQKKKHD